MSIIFLWYQCFQHIKHKTQNDPQIGLIKAKIDLLLFLRASEVSPTKPFSGLTSISKEVRLCWICNKVKMMSSWKAQSGKTHTWGKVTTIPLLQFSNCRIGCLCNEKHCLYIINKQATGGDSTWSNIFFPPVSILVPQMSK